MKPKTQLFVSCISWVLSPSKVVQKTQKTSGKSCTQVRFMLHCKCIQTV